MSSSWRRRSPLALPTATIANAAPVRIKLLARLALAGRRGDQGAGRAISICDCVDGVQGDVARRQLAA
jgi:hypothetical protein